MSIDTYSHHCLRVEHLRRDAQQIDDELARAQLEGRNLRAQQLREELMHLEEEFQNAQEQTERALGRTVPRPIHRRSHDSDRRPQ